MKVLTTQGLIDRSALEVQDEIEDTETARITATLWFLDGKLVRRDVHVNVLRGFEVGVTSGE